MGPQRSPDLQDRTQEPRTGRWEEAEGPDAKEIRSGSGLRVEWQLGPGPFGVMREVTPKSKSDLWKVTPLFFL